MCVVIGAAGWGLGLGRIPPGQLWVFARGEQLRSKLPPCTPSSLSLNTQQLSTHPAARSSVDHETHDHAGLALSFGAQSWSAIVQPNADTAPFSSPSPGPLSTLRPMTTRVR